MDREPKDEGAMYHVQRYCPICKGKRQHLLQHGEVVSSALTRFQKFTRRCETCGLSESGQRTLTPAPSEFDYGFEY